MKFSWLCTPVLMICIFVIYIVKPGFTDHFFRLRFNDLDHMTDIKMWMLVFEVVLFNLGIGTGAIVTFSSYNSFYSRRIRKDVTVVCIISFIVNVIVAIFILENIGVIAYNLIEEMYEVRRKIFI